MKINWLVRFKNKATVTTLATLLIGIASGMISVGNLLGWWSVNFDTEKATTQATAIIGLVFALIGGITGIIVDPTTAGIGDSKQAQAYTEPKKDIAAQASVEETTAAAQGTATVQKKAQEAEKAQTEAPKHK